MLRALSSLTSDVCRDMASTTILGNLCQCLTTLIVKKSLPYVLSKSLLSYFETISPSPITKDPAKEFVPTFLTAPLLIPEIRYPQRFLQIEQPQLS